VTALGAAERCLLAIAIASSIAARSAAVCIGRGRAGVRASGVAGVELVPTGVVAPLADRASCGATGDVLSATLSQYTANAITTTKVTASSTRAFTGANLVMRAPVGKTGPARRL